MAIATVPIAEDVPDVSPPLAKTTDISRISLTAPMAFALMASIGTLIGAFYTLKSGGDMVTLSIQSDVRDIRTRMEYEAKLNEQRFSALDAKIESAGLRNANMNLAQELAKASEKLKAR